MARAKSVIARKAKDSSFVPREFIGSASPVVRHAKLATYMSIVQGLLYCTQDQLATKVSQVPIKFDCTVQELTAALSESAEELRTLGELVEEAAWRLTLVSSSKKSRRRLASQMKLLGTSVT